MPDAPPTTSTTTCTCRPTTTTRSIEYWALAQRRHALGRGGRAHVEVTGPDADRLIDMLTCRDLTKCAGRPGQVHAGHGPGRRHRERPGAAARRGEPLVDAARRLRRRPLRDGRGCSTRPGRRGPPARRLPGAGPGAEAAKTVCQSWSATPSTTSSTTGATTSSIEGIPVVISRTGWTGEVGLRGLPARPVARRRPLGRGPRGGRGVQHPADRAVRGAADRGRHLQLRLRHDARRHAVPRHGARAPGRGAAAGLHRQGRARAHPCARASTASSSASSSDGDELAAELSEVLAGRERRARVGHVTDAVWSPGLKKNIGYVWVPIELAEPGTSSTSSPTRGTSWQRPRRSRSLIRRKRFRPHPSASGRRRGRRLRR